MSLEFAPLDEDFTEVFVSFASPLSPSVSIPAEVESETQEIQREHELLVQATMNGVRHQTSEIGKDVKGLYAYLHRTNIVFHFGIPPGFPTKVISVTMSATYNKLINKSHDELARNMDRDTLIARYSPVKLVKLATVSLTFIWALPGGEIGWTEIEAEDSRACQKCLKLVAKRDWKDVLQVNFKEAR